MSDVIYSRKEAAKYLGISLSTFDRMARRKISFLVPVIIGSRTLYRAKPIELHYLGEELYSLQNNKEVKR